MIRDRQPFFLSEAQISLYRADANGNPSTGKLWIGGFVNELETLMDFDEVLMSSSGDNYSTAHHVDENHVLNLKQTWIIFMPTVQDWKPARNQPYVLQLVWTINGVWLRRTYYGVTWRSLKLDSQSTNQFLVGQVLRAQRYVDDTGVLSGGTQPTSNVPSPAPGQVQVINFLRETALITGSYLLGFYVWTSAVNLVSATVVANAPQVQPVVLGLEVAGILTGQTITIPVGTANTQVEATVNLTGAVLAGQMARWKVLSGPDPVNTADGCSLAIQITG